MEKRGIDLSTYQENVNYMCLKADGIEFAIIRSGFGKNESQKDDMFESHYSHLKNLGIPIGIYHFSYVTSKENAILEAKNCLKFIGNKKIELPVFYDLEAEVTLNLGKEEITECAIAFCEEIKKAGYIPGVYANLNWFTNYIDVNKLIEKGYKIWLAQWNDKITAPFKVDYWQYTSKGQVHGIEGNIDLDISYDDFSKYTQSVENSVENLQLNRYEIRKNLYIKC